MTRPLKAAVPYMSQRGSNCLQPADLVTVRGVLRPGAQQFSINFTSSDCDSPDNIIYHFKIDLEEQFLIENSKENGDWNEDEIASDNNSLQNENGSGEFAFRFAFDDDKINTFMMQDATPSYVTSFAYRNNLTCDRIRCVQVWDDVEKITEVSFQFN